ncbi:hypothetical protein WOLCODRAFT_162479 [Wolfiporia cocos MD-104 SS10]|uniref:Uncharacterized protein n=1 Tax=Wolfiporia cocos (strain MD-104) TaxID=742152 RepID=A0A2H3JX13_WOLCO|nr:hypothetical protein WOLCODRAFT_162479 [Wolfiporia cocos MD-104 SS10]
MLSQIVQNNGGSVQSPAAVANLAPQRDSTRSGSSPNLLSPTQPHGTPHTGPSSPSGSPGVNQLCPSSGCLTFLPSTSRAASSCSSTATAISQPQRSVAKPHPASPGTSRPHDAVPLQLRPTFVVEHARGGVPPPRRLDDVSPELAGWYEMGHLNGSVYFWHPAEKIITPDNLLKPGIVTELMQHVRKFRSHLLSINAYALGILGRGGREDLVVRGVESDAGPQFLLIALWDGSVYEPVWLPSPASNEPAPERLLDLAYEQRSALFWKQIEAFPMHLAELPHFAEQDFMNALAYGISESIFEWTNSDYTVSTFTQEKSEQLIQVYLDLKEAADRGLKKYMVPVMAWHIARAMIKVEEDRHEHRYGKQDWQLYRSVAIDGPTWQVKLMDFFLSLVLFGIQRMYRLRLQGAYIKGRVDADGLGDLFEHFLDEWADSNLLATVFIGANIGFLANISNMQKTALLVSSVFAVMSVAIGVHHIWQHRTKVDASPEEAKHYLTHAHPLGEQSNLAVIACFLALPVASLLWSIIAFAVALGSFSIHNTDARGEVLLAVALAILGTVCIATLLFFWHIWQGPLREEIVDLDPVDMDERGWRSAFRREVQGLKDLLRGRSGPKVNFDDDEFAGLAATGRRRMA